MTVLQMLSEMICPEELLVLIALSIFVRNNQVLSSYMPIGLGHTRKLGSTIATYVGRTRRSERLMESISHFAQGRTRPRKLSNVERVLVTFCFVLILEPIWAVLALVQLLCLMVPKPRH
jgi:hypothetical protein